GEEGRELLAEEDEADAAREEDRRVEPEIEPLVEPREPEGVDERVVGDQLPDVDPVGALAEPFERAAEERDAGERERRDQEERREREVLEPLGVRREPPDRDAPLERDEH